MRYAGFWRRFVSAIIDGIILSIIIWILSAIGIVSTPFMAGITPEDIARLQTLDPNSAEYQQLMTQTAFDVMNIFSGAMLILWIVSIVIYWLYFALLESSPAQATIGKMALGLRVTNMQGERIGFGQATGRYFAKFISAIILLIGYLMAGFTEKKQALHDIIAGTLVLKKPEAVFTPMPPPAAAGR